MEALASLLERRQRWGELASFLSEWATAATCPEPIFARLARVHRDYTGDFTAAIVAFLGAHEWTSAALLWEAKCSALGDDAQLAVRLVAALRDAQCFAEAESVLRRRLERLGRSSPKDRATLFCDLAEVIYAGGRPEAAIKELSSALALFPSDPKILGMLGRTAFQYGDLDKAEQSYRMLLLVLRRPEEGGDVVLSRAEVYVELSEVAERRADEAAARDYMASAFEVSVDSRSEAVGLERALRRAQKPELLERALDRRIEQAADASEAARALESLVEAAGARLEGDVDFAKRVLAHADRIWADLAGNLADAAGAEAARTIVGVFRRLGEGRRAASALSGLASHTAAEGARQGLELEVVRELLALPAARSEAVDWLRTVVEGDPAHDEAFALLCTTLEADGCQDDVLGLIRARLQAESILQSPEEQRALRLRMAMLLEQMGRVEEAVVVYEELEQEPAVSADALRAIVRLEESRGAPAARLAAILRRLLMVEQGPARAALALRILELPLSRADADAAAEVDTEWDEEEQTLALGFAADPTHPELRERLVRLHEARGDAEKAAAVLETAVQALPDDVTLRLQLADSAFATRRCRRGAPNARPHAGHAAGSHRTEATPRLCASSRGAVRRGHGRARGRRGARPGVRVGAAHGARRNRAHGPSGAMGAAGRRFAGRTGRSREGAPDRRGVAGA